METVCTNLIRYGLFCLLSGLLLTACNGGGGSGNTPDGATGGVQIVLTDAASDLIDRFEVDVTAIDLLKNNGARVHALPITTRVNFADLVDLAELVNSTSVPQGAYEATELILDFSTAVVHIAGAAGNATILDDAGNPLVGSLTVKIQLDGNRPLVVSPGLARILTLDFDLDASTTVNTTLNTVAVGPVLTAEIDFERQRDHRVRGPLVEVDLQTRSFVIELRPFRLKESRFGDLRVYIKAVTHFEINGLPRDGLAGIQAMANLPALTAVVAIGMFQPPEGAFVATEVLVGSSAPGGGLDAVKGLVASRSGDVLSVMGAELDRSSGSVTWNAAVTVRLNPSATRVTRQFSSTAINTNAISVGQEIIAFGTLAGAPGSFVLDPAEQVRLLRTKVTGTVNSLPANGMVLDVQRIGQHLPSAFDFSGTGTINNDADPKNYQVYTGTMNLTGLHVGSPVRTYGFVLPFGSAHPDFDAMSVVAEADVAALLGVVWKSDAAVQFKVIDATGLTLDLAGAASAHHVLRGFVSTDLVPLPSVKVIPWSADPAFYSIRKDGMVTVHKLFASFAADLKARLDGGEDAQRITALGRFDDATGEMRSYVIAIHLKS